MTTRQLVYPRYDVEVVEGGDIRLRFTVQGSKFGPVDVIFIADDAMALLRLLDKALDKSEEMLAVESSA